MAEVHMYFEQQKSSTFYSILSKADLTKYRGDHAEYVHQIRDIRHLNQSLSWGAKDFTAKRNMTKSGTEVVRTMQVGITSSVTFHWGTSLDDDVVECQLTKGNTKTVWSVGRLLYVSRSFGKIIFRYGTNMHRAIPLDERSLLEDNVNPKGTMYGSVLRVS
ncbi:hypothetical protein L208DRAFT_323185 [Tricholoma matsutake]|nr:hypothetical protein L208DRAFT_323185 [Tricholoma matsutake 945]